jgi:predicted permease
LRIFFRRLIATFRRSDRQVDEEIRTHLDSLIEEGRRVGLSEREARFAALRTFGGVEQIKETYRDQRGLPLLDGLARDVRIALRTSLANRWFATVVIATLAMGIGATVAMFSVLDQVVLRPLPYPDSDRLVRLQSPVPGVRPDAVWNLSTAEYFYFRQTAHTLDQIGIYVTTSGTLGAVTEAPGSTAERVFNGLVSSEVFGLLGVKPVLGRLFVESDSRYNLRTEAAPAVILSYDVWQTRFGGSTDVIGRPIVFEDRAFPIVGVLGPAVELPENAFVPTVRIGIWMPLGLDPNAPAVNQHTFRTIARLRRGTPVAAAQAELETLTSRLPDLFPSAYSPAFMTQSRFSTAVVPLRDDVLGSARRMLWVLVGAIGLVFVIAATNIANLFLVRTQTRRRELVIRLALGATRLHLLRHTLAESLMLCIAAVAIALPLASTAIRALIALAPSDIPRLATVHLDRVSVAVATLAALVSAMSCAGFATVRSERDDQGGLRQRVLTISRGQHRIRKILVVAQVTLAVLLGAGASLTARTVQHLLRVDPGFDATGVVTFDLMLPRTRYTTEQRVADYHHELAAALEADPGIDSIGAGNSTPLDGNDGCTAVFIEGQSRGAGRGACVDTPRVTPGYFRALRIKIRGQLPGWDHSEGVFVSDSLARRLWPGEEAIGKGIRVNGDGPPYYRVVGIAADIRRHGLDRPPAESVYFPVVSRSGAPLFGPPRGMRVVIRARTQDIGLLIPRVRSIVTGIDPSVPIANVQMLSEVIGRSLAQSSFTTALLAVAALLAILLSAVGVYGVVSYGVISRQSEFGVRLALGARPGGVRVMVIRETLSLMLIGVGLGVAASLWSTQFLSGLLFGVGPRDPATLIALSVLMLAVGIAAGFLPAWRASRIDPMVALRCE